MEERNSFSAILIGKSGKYYSAHTSNIGKVPLAENAKITDLVYDYHTKVMYYLKYNGKKIAFGMPYLSENGKYCRFVDDEIVEIN